MALFFSNAHVDAVIQKAFTVDRVRDQNVPLSDMLQDFPTDRFPDDKYTTVDNSKQVLVVWFKLHNIPMQHFIDDAYDIMSKRKAKCNVLFLQGVPCSGKSFIARSLNSLKYNQTIQGTSSFLFMELAQASCVLIEEPVFPLEHLQKFKTIVEGAPTDVSVKHKAAVTVPRLPS